MDVLLLLAVILVAMTAALAWVRRTAEETDRARVRVPARIERPRRRG